MFKMTVADERTLAIFINKFFAKRALDVKSVEICRELNCLNVPTSSAYESSVCLTFAHKPKKRILLHSRAWSPFSLLQKCEFYRGLTARFWLIVRLPALAGQRQYTD